ncbi:hypothetical protein, partial [Corynebacterium sp.]|uniref:hypothetical protein n=1 Tax=Corynebacterium sp. TaxID=1720 RepID=UPI0026DC29D6
MTEADAVGILPREVPTHGKRAATQKTAGNLHLEPKSAGEYAAKNKSAGVYGPFSAIFIPYPPSVFTTDP